MIRFTYEWEMDEEDKPFLRDRHIPSIRKSTIELNEPATLSKTLDAISALLQAAGYAGIKEAMNTYEEWSD